MAELDLEELKRIHDRNYEHNKITRERAADDIIFYHVTQWDESTIGGSNLAYKGEFNIIRKAGRKIIGDLRSNPVQLDFQPKNEDNDDGADLLDGYYRTVSRQNTSIEASDNAKAEAVVCGIGGWELYTEYENNQLGDKNQVIKKRPLYEFNNNVFWDDNAVLMDKSDARSCSILVPLSRSGMEDLVKELTGREESIDLASFSNPEHSYTFPWISGKSETLYAVRFYQVTKVKDKVLEMVDPMGQTLNVLESSLSQIMDELIEDGYTINPEGSKAIERDKVMLYIANGSEILKSYEIAGAHIPVPVVYGERAMVEGEEHYEGVTRLAKDPQRLRNFQMSYLADIVSRSPRPKPIFLPEQLSGLEWMYEETGADNNLPYYLQNRLTASGEQLPIGPVAVMPEQTVPQALMQSLVEMRQAVSDVAPANISEDVSDVDLSGKALQQLSARLDDQSVVFQQNFKSGLRREGEIFASMASVILDAPRSITITKPDGTRSHQQIMETILDEETGELIVLNDLTGSEFEVFADIGPSYTSKKEESFTQLGEMSMSAAAINPALAEMFLLKQTELIDGINMQDIRDYSRKQLILKGYREPDKDNEEEIAWMQEAQQNQQPDAMLVAAQAEDKKAEAEIAEVQRKTQADQFKAQTDMQKVEVTQFDAQTKRLAVQVDAQVAEANMEFKRIDSFTKRMDSHTKQNQFRASASQLG